MDHVQNQSNTTSNAAHVKDQTGRSWLYSDIVKEHFFHPKNLLIHGQEDGYEADASGRVGSPACGDEMVLWLKIDKETDKIVECKWQTFGCGSAIASTSMMSVMVTENGGMTIDEALRLKPQHIMERLGGLPARKIHCSVLGDKALRAAINDWFRKTGQHSRIKVEGAKVIDATLHITDHDIEEAVLEGARTLEEVQKKLKVGVGDPAVIPEIKQLIRFYSEKYYGKES